MSVAVDAEFLKSISYFSELSPAELDSIKQFVFDKAFQRGEVILLEGEVAEALYFDVSGATKVFKTSVDGKEQILSIVRPGEPLNSVPLLDGGPNPASAEAMGPVILYGIRKNDLRSILEGYPQVAMNIAKELAGRVRQLVSLVEDLSFKQVIGRVAKILLENAADGTGHVPQFTQQEMAAMAGTAREVVARSLKALEEEGAIRLQRRRIAITDREALKEMVGTSS